MSTKPLRVLCLMHPGLVPPEDVSGHDVTDVPWKMEFDVSVTLRNMGHEVLALGVEEDLAPIRRTVGTWKPDIVFNLLESFHNVSTFDQHVASFLELLRVPYTGCNLRGLTLARDKALSKEILAAHGVDVPRFLLFERGARLPRRSALPFPGGKW